jgi:CHASE3 domain sensor protein
MWVRILCVLTFLITVYCGWRFTQVVDGLDSMTQVRTASRDLLISLLDAETGQRGYIITGNQLYLGPYHAGLQMVKPDLDVLTERIHATRGSSEIAQHIQSLVSQKMSELETTLEMRDKDFNEAIREVNSHLGKNLMDQIREQLQDVEMWAEDRSVEFQVSGRLYGCIGFLTLIATFILGSIALVRGRPCPAPDPEFRGTDE